MQVICCTAVLFESILSNFIYLKYISFLCVEFEDFVKNRSFQIYKVIFKVMNLTIIIELFKATTTYFSHIIAREQFSIKCKNIFPMKIDFTEVLI